ncbi:MAG: hypothetical protein Q9192_001711 [Flavoplaca navasiana]
MAPSQRASGPLQPQSFPQAQKFSNSSNGGRPKQPARKGPRPARHIPWPEIFKHHISLVEGHLKMIDMVRKHTVEGTGNYRTICEMIDHTKRILYESKTVARIFVPPNDHIEQVPLGSSSESMYPGYSIKEHKYGEAAERFGNYAAEAKRKGEEIKAEGVDYKLGQSKALSSLKLEQMRAKMAAQKGGGSASESALADSTSTEKKVRFSDVSQETAKPEGQMFFMDSEPTPVDLPTALNTFRKRKESSLDAEPTPEPVEAQPSKKARRDHVGHVNEPHDANEGAKARDTTSQINDKPEQAAGNIQVEYEDISDEVEKRMQEKEEKRKRKDQPKEKKKRKRDSEGSTAGAVEGAATTEVEKPKKKKTKSKTTEDGDAVGRVSSKEDTAMADGDIIEGENAEPSGSVYKPKKKKKAKAPQDSSTLAKDGLDSGESGEDSSKKKNKEKKAKASVDAASPAQNDAADANSSSTKRSLVEYSGEQAEGEESTSKKKKAKISKDASILDENAVQERGDKRPADVAEVGDVEDEGNKKKQKKRKST